MGAHRKNQTMEVVGGQKRSPLPMSRDTTTISQRIAKSHTNYTHIA